MNITVGMEIPYEFWEFVNNRLIMNDVDVRQHVIITTDSETEYLIPMSARDEDDGNYYICGVAFAVCDRDAARSRSISWFDVKEVRDAVGKGVFGSEQTPDEKSWVAERGFGGSLMLVRNKA